MYRGREVDLLPKITGGGNEGGRLIANDAENILLEYDLERFHAFPGETINLTFTNLDEMGIVLGTRFTERQQLFEQDGDLDAVGCP